AHVATMLKMAGVADPEAKAVGVLALETGIARAFAPDEDAADVFKQNNPWKRSDFGTKAPGMDWNAFFRGAGLTEQTDFVVWQPSAVIGVSAQVGNASLEQWKDYLRFHLVEHFAPVLPKALAAEHFAFGQLPADREKAAISATNSALGQAVGQLYAQRYFPPAAKAKAQAMVRSVIAAYRAHLAGLGWMSPETKQKAQAKLDSLTIGLGYPDTWIDYSAFQVVRGDAFGNQRRAEAFNRARNIAQMKQAADPAEWRIDA